MSNHVLIKNGVVVQSDRTWDGDGPHPDGFIAASESVVPGFLYSGGEFSAPVIEPSLVVTILDPVDLWSRLTEAEAAQVVSAMATQSVRIQNIFKAASSYRSDHELWPLLQAVAVNLFGEARAAEILAPSEGR